MTNDAIHLRPVEERDLATLERIDKERALSEPFESRGFGNPAERRRRWERDGYLGDGEGLCVAVGFCEAPGGMESSTPVCATMLHHLHLDRGDDRRRCGTRPSCAEDHPSPTSGWCPPCSSRAATWRLLRPSLVSWRARVMISCSRSSGTSSLP